MRILVISQYFWPESFRINDLVESLTARGHQVSVLTGTPSYPERSRFMEQDWRTEQAQAMFGVQIHRVPMLGRGNGKGIFLLFNYLSYALSASLLGPWLCRGKFDAIFVFQPSPVTIAIPAIVMKWFKRAPVTWWVQDLWPETLEATGVVRSSKLLNMVGRLVKSLYRKVDHILVPAPSALQAVKKYGVSDEKAQFFPNWAEDFYQPVTRTTNLRRELGLPEQGFILLFAGNIGISQSFKTILAAAELHKENKDIHWVVVGDGRRFAWLNTEIKVRRLTEQFHLLGRKPAQSMPDYFAAADVLLMSLTKNPIFSVTIPSKLQSYMACGRPVLASIDGDGAHVVEEAKAGKSAPAEDPVALAQSLQMLYDMPCEAREQLGQNALRYYQQHFARDALISQLETMLTQQTQAREKLCES